MKKYGFLILDFQKKKLRTNRLDLTPEVSLKIV